MAQVPRTPVLTPQQLPLGASPSAQVLPETPVLSDVQLLPRTFLFQTPTPVQVVPEVRQ